jgi:hypothetical protein
MGALSHAYSPIIHAVFFVLSIFFDEAIVAFYKRFVAFVLI